MLRLYEPADEHGKLYTALLQGVGGVLGKLSDLGVGVRSRAWVSA